MFGGRKLDFSHLRLRKTLSPHEGACYAQGVHPAEFDIERIRLATVPVQLSTLYGKLKDALGATSHDQQFPIDQIREALTLLGVSLPWEPEKEPELEPKQEKTPHKFEPEPIPEEFDALDRLLERAYLALRTKTPKPSAREIWRNLNDYDEEKIIVRRDRQNITLDDPDKGAQETLACHTIENRLGRFRKRAG